MSEAATSGPPPAPPPPRELMERYLLDVGRDGRLELLESLAQPDMVDEANRAFGGPPGRAGLVAHAKGFRRNVADVDVRIDRIVAGVDEVMARWSFAGRHVGPWLGRPATHAPVTGTVFSFFDLREGRISRYRLWLHAVFSDGEATFDGFAAGDGGRR
ncbi:MAG: ester cyclase [Pseudomonadota bacterium]